MKILVDTREQKPLFPKAQRVTLNVGDYTTERLKKKFVIERKSLMDLYQTLVANNGRFKYELFRAAYFRIELQVFVEGTQDDFINKNFPKGEDRKFPSEGLRKMLKTFEKKYYLKFVWCGSRPKTIKMVQNTLKSKENIF